MKSQLARINRKVTAMKAKLGQIRLANLPGMLQRYATDGQRPDDLLAQSATGLTESATACMDASIGGDGYDQACQRYEAALTDWRRTLREAGL